MNNGVAQHDQKLARAFEELIRKFAELSNETAGEHFTPHEVVRLMVNLSDSSFHDPLVRIEQSCEMGSSEHPLAHATNLPFERLPDQTHHIRQFVQFGYVDLDLSVQPVPGDVCTSMFGVIEFFKGKIENQA